MKASELYAILKKMTPTARGKTHVVLSCDAEGNVYSPLHNAVVANGREFEYDRISRHLSNEVTPGEPVLVLWPV